MSRVLFLFLDGVGLGGGDAQKNPFARAEMPCLQQMLGGRALLLDSLKEYYLDGRPAYLPLETESATLLAMDAGLGVPGLPQSASGQATLLTGKNVPASLGFHYGPKPNRAIAEILLSGNLFTALVRSGSQAALLNAYPPSFFSSVFNGKRLLSAIPLAVTYAGVPLKTEQDLRAGRALSADFTGLGWKERFGLDEAFLLEPHQAGARLADLASHLNFAFFEFWLSDYAGHSQDMEAACNLLELLDGVLCGLLEAWDERSGLILITSDHGNLEDLSTRRHTNNPVPVLLIGSHEARREFAADLRDLTDIAPTILKSFDLEI